MTDLNKLLTEAEAERIGLEAQVRLLRKGAYESLPAVINSTLIQTLKEQLARLEGDYASLSTQLKAGYPRLAQLEAQVKETQQRLKQEIHEVVWGIESAYVAAEAKEQELRAKMEEQKGAALGLKDASVEYAILDREVDTNRQLYDSVLQRIKEMEVATELRASNVFVIDKATPPLNPAKPKKLLSLLLSAVAGLGGGVGVAFFCEYLDEWTRLRQAHARLYTELLSHIPGIVPPVVLAGATHVYHLYVIRVEQSSREALQQYLRESGVQTGIHYPQPIPSQKRLHNRSSPSPCIRNWKGVR